MRHLFMLLCAISVTYLAAEARDPSLPHVIDHAELKSYMNQGNTLTGIATPSLGASDCEVWHSSIAVNSCTPLHQHETQEIFIFLKGQGKALVGEKELYFEAPCTLLLPAGIPHQIFNVGNEPSEQIVILKPHSEIYNMNGSAMQLPWRN